MKTATYEGVLITYYVEMPTTDDLPASITNDEGYDSPFAISVHSPSQWAALEAEGGPIGTKIGQTSQYVFSWSHSNGGPPSDWQLDGDINGIIDSFKVN